MTLVDSIKPGDNQISKQSKEKASDELSEEDQKLKDELEELVKNFSTNPNKESLVRLNELIKTATTSMTSVPKPLKFLHQHYAHLRDGLFYGNEENLSIIPIYKQPGELRNAFADILSVLAMSVCDQEAYKLDTIKFCIISNESFKNIGNWGHEYIRHLANESTQLILQEDINIEDSAKDSKMEIDSQEKFNTEDDRSFICQYEKNLKNKPQSADSMEVVVENKEENEKFVQILSNSLLLVIHSIIEYLMDHNGEAEAVDLCQETLGTKLIIDKCSSSNFQRTCCYLISCIPYLSNETETIDILETCYKIYSKFGEACNALRCALKMDADMCLKHIVELLNNPPGPEKDCKVIRKQLCYTMARHSKFIDFYQEGLTFNFIDDTEELSQLEDILRYEQLSENFHYLCRELDIMDAKVPEDVYKSHLEPNQFTSSNYDSAKVNQAKTFVNGMLNCGFSKDKMIAESTDSDNWVAKNKEVGMLDAVASLGWIMLWDVNQGLSQIDKYLYSKDNYVRAGAILAIGVVNSTVRNSCDPAIALLTEFLKAPTQSTTPAGVAERLNCTSAIIGMGLAYAGTSRSDALELLYQLLVDMDTSKFDLACLAALSIGLISIGNPHTRAGEEILQCLMSRPAKDFESPFTKFMSLGLALTVLGDPKAVLPLLSVLATVREPARSMTAMLIECCSLAGTGNVLKVQELLHILLEKYDGSKSGPAEAAESTDKKSSKSAKKKSSTVDLDASEDENADETNMEVVAPTNSKKAESSSVLGLRQELIDGSQFFYSPHQPAAVLCISLIAMGDDITQDMAFRMFGHLLRFGELPIKRAVPLALALCYASNPQLKVLDLLSKFSHDLDPELCYNSIFAMGIVGAGTNNARLAAMLRQLAVFQRSDVYNLLMVRLAQGLTHFGKGTLSLNPWHSDRLLLNPCALGGLLSVLVAMLDVRKTFLNKMDYLMFYLTPAIHARLLVTLNADDQTPLPVTVRVGQAVDIVGQVGQRPKTITGFQTHTTPVLLAYGERAELATEQYIPVSKNLPLEGFVLLKKNPDYVE